jgi:hypothetical protein
VICNWSIYGDGFPSEHGFIPLEHTPVVDSGDYDWYQAQFITTDSSLLLTRTYIAPKDLGDQGNFLIQVLGVQSFDGEDHLGVTIGEAVDWDIPADSGVRNRSGFDLAERMIWQVGSEYDTDDYVECQENDDRYGGISLVGIFQCLGEDAWYMPNFYGAYTEDNSTNVYPTGGFVPEELDSAMKVNEGYVLESDSMDSDQHTVMTYRVAYPLPPDETLIAVTCLVSGRMGYSQFISSVSICHVWWEEHFWPPIGGGCLGMIRGNIDCDFNDVIDISDLVYLVDYMFNGGPEPWCLPEVDVNADDQVDISDLVYLVDYMFSGGPPPAPCGGGELLLDICTLFAPQGP